VDGRQAPLGLRLHTQHNFPQGFLQAALSSFSLIKHEVLRQPASGLRIDFSSSLTRGPEKARASPRAREKTTLAPPTLG